MTLDEIKRAVDAGKTVHWKNPAYQVIPGFPGAYLINCTLNDHCIGLTWADGVTMNGKPDDFYIDPQPPAGYTAEELERDNPYNQWMHE